VSLHELSDSKVLSMPLRTLNVHNKTVLWIRSQN
jgi:hypothetical protein